MIGLSINNYVNSNSIRQHTSHHSYNNRSRCIRAQKFSNKSVRSAPIADFDEQDIPIMMHHNQSSRSSSSLE